MPQYMSDHFTAETPADSTTLAQVANPRLKVAAGFSRARMYHTFGYINGNALSSVAGGLNTLDVLRFFSLKSGDRLVTLELSLVGLTTTSGACAGGVGLYESGANHDGATIDTNNFADVVDFKTDRDRLNVFNEAAGVNPLDYGKELWELADLGAASYGKDPQQDWDVCVTFLTGSDILTGGEWLLECTYVSSLGA